MNGEPGQLFVVSEIDKDYALSIVSDLKVVYRAEPDTIWEINQKVNLYLWLGHENKFYLVRFKSGIYTSGH